LKFGVRGRIVQKGQALVWQRMCGKNEVRKRETVRKVKEKGDD